MKRKTTEARLALKIFNLRARHMPWPGVWGALATPNRKERLGHVGFGKGPRP